MIPGLEEDFLAYARQHDLKRIDVGMMKMDHGDQYLATVWWKMIHHETACAIGNGESVIDALGQALDAADRIRAEARLSAMREQPLPIYTPLISLDGAAA